MPSIIKMKEITQIMNIKNGINNMKIMNTNNEINNNKYEI